MTIKEALRNKKITFNTFYHRLYDLDIGYWEDIRSREDVKKYYDSKKKEGLNVSYLSAIVDSDIDLWNIFMEDPMDQNCFPIKTKQDLVKALELDEEDLETVFDLAYIVTDCCRRATLEDAIDAIKVTKDSAYYCSDCEVNSSVSLLNQKIRNDTLNRLHIMFHDSNFGEWTERVVKFVTNEIMTTFANYISDDYDIQLQNEFQYSKEDIDVAVNKAIIDLLMELE